jgi:hypothetical protein
LRFLRMMLRKTPQGRGKIVTEFTTQCDRYRRGFLRAFATEDGASV